MMKWLLLIPILILLAFLIVWFGSNAPAVAQSLYEADLTYSPVATGTGPIGIQGASVTNFRKITLTSLTPLKHIYGITTAGNVEAHIKVFCEGEEVFSFIDKFRMMAVSLVDRQVTIRNLPPGATCRYSITLVCEPFGGVHCKEEPVWGPALTDFQVPQ